MSFYNEQKTYKEKYVNWQNKRDKYIEKKLRSALQDKKREFDIPFVLYGAYNYAFLEITGKRLLLIGESHNNVNKMVDSQIMIHTASLCRVLLETDDVHLYLEGESFNRDSPKFLQLFDFIKSELETAYNQNIDKYISEGVSVEEVFQKKLTEEPFYQKYILNYLEPEYEYDKLANKIKVTNIKYIEGTTSSIDKVLLENIGKNNIFNVDNRCQFIMTKQNVPYEVGNAILNYVYYMSDNLITINTFIELIFTLYKWISNDVTEDYGLDGIKTYHKHIKQSLELIIEIIEYSVLQNNDTADINYWIKLFDEDITHLVTTYNQKKLNSNNEFMKLLIMFVSDNNYCIRSFVGFVFLFMQDLNFIEMAMKNSSNYIIYLCGFFHTINTITILTNIYKNKNYIYRKQDAHTKLLKVNNFPLL